MLNHRILFVAAAAAVCRVAVAQWPNVCPVSGTYSAWNRTACPAGATCCANGFAAGGGIGCCPYANATCCASGYQCCPGGTTCVSISGTGYSEVYQCVDSNKNNVTTSKCPCKMGPPLPMSTTKKNVLIIGDSLTIGYTPPVADELADIALVQHAPWDTSDGGAEETAYGVQCLDYWLHSPSGLPYKADVIWFNHGMHDYVVNCTPGNGCVPGQSGNSSVYPGELQNITTRLQAYATSVGAKLIFGITSPMLCDATIDAVISGVLNPAAAAIMKEASIPTVDLHKAITDKCGPVPQPSCMGNQGCWCPHCPPMYAWLAQTTVAPAIRALLEAMP